MSDEKALATTVPERAPSVYSGSAQAFETAQRQAKALAESDFVPEKFRGKIANCLVALEIAQRSNSSPLAVMQNLYVVHGKPSWSAQYIIASINSSGRFSPLRFIMSADKTYCHAEALDRSTNEIVAGPMVTIEMAKKEGWYQKSGSKWQTMPELMLQYRAGTFFGRLHCPEILLGMQTQEELRDVGPEPSENQSRAAEVQERIRQRAQAPDIEV